MAGSPLVSRNVTRRSHPLREARGFEMLERKWLRTCVYTYIYIYIYTVYIYVAYFNGDRQRPLIIHNIVDHKIVDHTTVSAKVTRELANISKGSGVEFIDAPVSGGQAGAINGQLGVMCGGDPDTYIKAEKIISSYAKVCKLLGPSGAGQLTKMVNQICIAGLVQGLSEGLNFAEKAGLDVKEVVDVISAGAAGSWQMVNRHETMSADKFDHGFAVDWMRKDLGICLSTAEENGASLPVTALVDQFYKEVQNIGGGRWDTSSLIKRLNNKLSK